MDTSALAPSTALPLVPAPGTASLVALAALVAARRTIARAVS